MNSFKSGFACLSLAILTACQSPSQSRSASGIKVSGFGQSLEWQWNFDRWLGQPLESEAEVGKWASQRKKGSQAQYGFVSQPLAADFSLTVASPTSENINRLVAIPLPADRWGVLVVHTSTGVVAFQTSGLVTPLVATPLVTGQIYKVYVAWFSGTARASEYTFVGSFTGGS